MTEIIPIRRASSDIFAGVSRSIDWINWMRPVWGPMGGAKTLLSGMERALAVAEAHPCASVRRIRLEMTLCQAAELRSLLDEITLGASQALEQAKRDEGGDAA